MIVTKRRSSTRDVPHPSPACPGRGSGRSFSCAQTQLYLRSSSSSSSSSSFSSQLPAPSPEPPVGGPLLVLWDPSYMYERASQSQIRCHLFSDLLILNRFARAAQPAHLPKRSPSEIEPWDLPNQTPRARRASGTQHYFVHGVCSRAPHCRKTARMTVSRLRQGATLTCPLKQRRFALTGQSARTCG